MRPVAVPGFQLVLHLFLGLGHVLSLVLRDFEYVFEVIPLHLVQTSRDRHYGTVVKVPALKYGITNNDNLLLF